MAADATAFRRIRLKLLPLSLAAALALPATAPAFADNAHAAIRAQHDARAGTWPQHAPKASAMARSGADFRPAKPLATCDDAGLRAAIAGAASGDMLDLTACSTITLTAGEIHINVDDLTLNGPGAGHLTIDGGATGYYYFNRIFDHTGAGTVSINGMTLADAHYIGYVPGDIVKGGCIYSAGSVSLSNAVLTRCMVDTITSDYALGGAIYARGDLTLVDSAVSSSTAFSPYNEAEGGGVFGRSNFDATDSSITDDKVVAPSSYAIGGGLVVLGSGDLHIERSTLSGNQAEFGGGAYVVTTGSVEIANSTISSNYASLYVGGAVLIPGATVANSTITGNTSASALLGVGIYGYDFTLQSSIVANNLDSAGMTMLDISAGSIGGAANLITSASSALPGDTIPDCPRLTALQDNGGPTLTHKLIEGSPAIDTGNNTIPLATDQRSTGFARTFGTKTDVGAYEWQGEPDDTLFRSAFEVRCDDY
jgi:hypothetical protein